MNKIFHYKIDINCDLGEGSNAEDCHHDAQLMPYLSRCNIACGGHAGNRQTMQLSIENTKKNKIVAGAHPGYADKANFGRKSLAVSLPKLADSIRAQIDELREISAKQNVSLQHIKLHGALYNDVEKQPDMAKSIADLFAEYYADLTIVALAQGKLCQAAKTNQLKVLNEGFIDRAYQDNKQLTPRSQTGSVYSDPQQAINQALKFAKGEAIHSITNQPLDITVDTLCLHGDNTNALTIAKQLHQKLIESGVQIL